MIERIIIGHLPRFVKHWICHWLDIYSPSKTAERGYACCPYCDRRVKPRK